MNKRKAPHHLPFTISFDGFSIVLNASFLLLFSKGKQIWFVFIWEESKPKIDEAFT